jgi:ribosome recycling factor
MSNLIDSYQKEFDKVIEYLKREIAGIRSSRVNTTLVENLSVEAYGTKMILKQLANIYVEGGRTIVIEAWDKHNIKNIEKAILDSDLGVNPVIEGDIIRLSFPPLTEEKRKELVKILHQKGETAKIGVRGIRDKIREEIFKKEKNKEISEDERYRLLKELDKKTEKINEQIKELLEKKEKEILEI